MLLQGSISQNTIIGSAQSEGSATASQVWWL